MSNLCFDPYLHCNGQSPINLPLLCMSHVAILSPTIDNALLSKPEIIVSISAYGVGLDGCFACFASCKRFTAHNMSLFLLGIPQVLRAWSSVGVRDADQLRKVLVKRSMAPIPALSLQARAQVTYSVAAWVKQHNIWGATSSESHCIQAVA